MVSKDQSIARSSSVSKLQPINITTEIKLNSKKQNWYDDTILSLEKKHSTTTDLIVEQFSNNDFQNLTYYSNKYVNKAGEIPEYKRRIAEKKPPLHHNKKINYHNIQENSQPNSKATPQSIPSTRKCISLSRLRRNNLAPIPLRSPVSKTQIIGQNKSESPTLYHKQMKWDKNNPNWINKDKTHELIMNEKLRREMEKHEVHQIPNKELNYFGIRSIMMKDRRARAKEYKSRNEQVLQKIEENKTIDIILPGIYILYIYIIYIYIYVVMNEEAKDEYKAYIKDSTVREYKHFPPAVLFDLRIEDYKAFETLYHANFPFLMESRRDKGKRKVKVRLEEESFDISDPYIYSTQNLPNIQGELESEISNPSKGGNIWLTDSGKFCNSFESKNKQEEINRINKHQDMLTAKLRIYKSTSPIKSKADIQNDSQNNIMKRRKQRYIKLLKKVLNSRKVEEKQVNMDDPHNSIKYYQFPIIRPSGLTFEENIYKNIKSHSLNENKSRAHKYAKWFLPPSQWNEHLKERGEGMRINTFDTSPLIIREVINYKKVEMADVELHTSIQEKTDLPQHLAKFMNQTLRKNIALLESNSIK